MPYRNITARVTNDAKMLVEQLLLKKCTLALAESCTGGLVSELITRVSGASAVLWGSYICYTPAAKQQMLCIDEGLLACYGPVSREIAREMALKALRLSGASISASVTGLAGPSGDGSGLPVGTVWIAVADGGCRRAGGIPAISCREKEMRFQGTRSGIRMLAAGAVMEELLKLLLDYAPDQPLDNNAPKE